MTSRRARPYKRVYRICWPLSADQPTNAIKLSIVHDVGYELLEVRTGPGLNKILHTGETPVGTLEAVRAEANKVLDKAFGEDGLRKRANMKKLKEKIERAWDQGGPAEVDMAKFLDSL